MFLSRGDRDLGVAFQTHPGRQAFISSGSKEPRSALESRRVSLGPTPVFLPGVPPGQRSLEGYHPWAHKESDTTEGLWASLVAQLVKNPPAMQENPVRFLGQEDPLEKG